jgi:hypothetical protein
VSAPVVNGVTLALIPNNADIITSGAQYIDPRLLPGLLASAADFRAEVGRPVFVREAYRSDADQLTIFLARYYRTPARTGVFYDGSYWQKRTGASTAAVPGSSAANHRLGLCLDLWSGIDTSFTSREHLVWVRVSAKHGWVNTGRGFGEPWHQQGTPGVSPAGSTITPLPESEEDDMPLTADERAALDYVVQAVKTIEARLATDPTDGVAPGGIVGRLAEIRAAQRDTQSLLAVDTDAKTGIAGGLRGLLRDIAGNAYTAASKASNVEAIVADDGGRGLRALLNRVVKKTGA